jgi:phage shock protein PspC (stress-responsive transcriptional regulator)
MDFKIWLQKFGKDSKGKMLGGVCSGLAMGTPIPVWLWRLMFVLAVILYGAGLVIYLILWIILPEHKFTAEEIARQQENALHFFKRTEQGQWIAGICSGLEIWTKIPAWVYRLFFILLTVVGGAGILLYLAMWIFVPRQDKG